MADKRAKLTIRFVDQVYRAPEFNRVDVDYLKQVVGSRMTALGVLERDYGRTLPEREIANELYMKLTQLWDYIIAANAQEIQCHAPGEGTEIRVPIPPPPTVQ